MLGIFFFSGRNASADCLSADNCFMRACCALMPGENSLTPLYFLVVLLGRLYSYAAAPLRAFVRARAVALRSLSKARSAGLKKRLSSGLFFALTKAI